MDKAQLNGMIMILSKICVTWNWSELANQNGSIRATLIFHTYLT